jgi:murein DD-endopeptidase MepM/ murein hydrolase activator NlpD
MVKISIDLPLGKRLHLALVKRRDNDIDQILPDVEDIKKIRKGSKISRYFRIIFENKKIRKLIGFNMPVFIIASSFIPQTSIFTKTEEINPQSIIVSVQNVETTTKKGVIYPTKEVKITQGFKFYHPGIDLDGITGDPIYPFMPGVVENISFSNYGYGNAVLINHGNGLNSLYAHLSKIMVKKGDFVDTQTKIGEMGKTGRSTGDHLHFEIRKDGIPFDPLLVLPKNQ